MARIIILLSTYNGHKYISQQIESIISQNIREDDNFELCIMVRDDGSSDDTLEILSSFSDRIKIDIYEGKNVGPARSFWELIHMAPPADYYAFCDQDDVWFKDKIKKAVDILSNNKDDDKPFLYCSSVEWTDSDLHPLELQKSRHSASTSFPYSLLYSISPGCTFVFNWSALEMARKYSFDIGHVEMHDWLLNKIVAMTGNVYYDRNPGMYYRQHGNNTIGMQNDGLNGLRRRIRRFLHTDDAGRSLTAKSLLTFYTDIIGKESKEYYYLDLVANYRESFRKRLTFMHEKKFRRSLVDTICLKGLILLGKI